MMVHDSYYCDHVENFGEGLFQLACQHDIEGVVAKKKFEPYLLHGSATWQKIRNQSYSQWIGREELFERERSSDADLEGWSSCALVCEDVHEVYAEAQ